MSFGRSFRPTTPTTTTSADPAHRSLSQIAHEHQIHAREEQKKHQHEAWMVKGMKPGGNRPEKTKWTPRTDAQTKEQLLAQRLAKASAPTSVLTVDPTYTLIHNTPFNSIKQVRLASWEDPVLNPDIPLNKLALLARPDLEEENQQHAAQVDQIEEQRRQGKVHESFLFREARLAALHRRKSNRIALEVRAALRADPETQRFRSIDAPQFATIPVPPPVREKWDSAHQLSHSLVEHPYMPPPHLTDLAIQAMDHKIAQEFKQTLEKRRLETQRKQDIYLLEESLRERNLQREHLLNSAFSARESSPQNLDAHLAYLTSARCSPRPPSARPVSVETHRVMSPFALHKLAHVRYAGSASLRTGRFYSLPVSAATTRPGTGVSTARGSVSRGDSYTPSTTISSAAQTYRPLTSSRHTDRHSVPGPTVSSTHRDPARITQSGLADLGDQIEHLSAEQEPRPYAIPPAGVTPLDLHMAGFNSGSPSLSPSSPSRSPSSLGPSVTSPRASSRLGNLTMHVSHPCSPRLMNLSQPLARFMEVRPLDHEHRDFRGLVRKEDQEEKQQDMQPLVEDQAKPIQLVSTLTSRPSTARSRFERESRSVRSPSPNSNSRPASPGKSPRPPSSITYAFEKTSQLKPSRPVSSGVKLHRNPERLPMWNRENRLLQFVGSTPRPESRQ